MTIHVLIPVHNRLALTRTVLECLRAQILDEHLSIIVIDDGSTDGSREFLSMQKDVTVLVGDGSLWWGGSIEVGLRHVLKNSGNQGWVIFVNNDTEFAPDFVQTLLETARHQAPAAVGSVIRDIDPPHRLLSIGAVIDPWRLMVRDLVEDFYNGGQEAGARSSCSPHEVSALSGRGVLYPVSVFAEVGRMRTRWLPHYLADYELSLRIHRAGCRLLVDERAVVFSPHEYGNSSRFSSLYERFFSIRSSSYLPAVIVFWWEASTWLQRLTLPFRAIMFSIFPGLRK